MVAIFAEIYSSSKFSLSGLDKENSEGSAHVSPVHQSLTKIELPSILFFLGILMAVAALESLGVLFGFADWLKESTPALGTEIDAAGISDLVVLLLGVGSAVIDNVSIGCRFFRNVLRTPRSSNFGTLLPILQEPEGVCSLLGLQPALLRWEWRKLTFFGT